MSTDSPSTTDRPRNQHCMNCGDTRGGPMGHETQECTYDSLPDKASYTSGSKLMAAVERHNERLSPEDRAAIKSHAARILDHEARVDALAAAIGRPRVKPVPTTDRLAEIRARLDAATPGPWHHRGKTVLGSREERDLGTGPAALLHTGMPYDGPNGRCGANAELAANAPADLAYLLAENARLRERLDTAEGQLAKWRELHQPERRYTPDDGETSYATYAEAADASFDGTGTPVSVTFFEVCSHCASIEMAEGCEHDYKESLWPCEDAAASGAGEEPSDV